MSEPQPAPGQLAHLENARWFTDEVQPHEPALRAYLRGRFPALPDVDDLIQDAYAKLLRAQSTGRIAEVRPYLFAMARNAAVDLLRRRQVITFEALGEIEHLSVVEERPDAAEDAAHAQEILLLNAAIAALPPRCREVLRLRRFEGHSVSQIAEQLNVSPKTVDAHLCLAVFRCRRFLLEHGVNRDRLTLLSADPSSPPTP